MNFAPLCLTFEMSWHGDFPLANCTGLSTMPWTNLLWELYVKGPPPFFPMAFFILLVPQVLHCWAPECPDLQDTQQCSWSYLKWEQRGKDTKKLTASLIPIKLSNFMFYTSQYKGKITIPIPPPCITLKAVEIYQLRTTVLKDQMTILASREGNGWEDTKHCCRCQ